MSQLKTSKPAKLNLSTGWSFFAVIKVTQQKHAGRKVIFQMRRTDSPLELTVGLDEKDQLRMWLTDAQAKKHKSKPLLKDTFFEKSVLLNAEIRPLQKGDVALSLQTLPGRKIETTVTATLGGHGPATYSLGATVEGDDNAAFTLAQMMIYSKPLEQTDFEKLRNYVSTRFAIKT